MEYARRYRLSAVDPLLARTVTDLLYPSGPITSMGSVTVFEDGAARNAPIVASRSATRSAPSSAGDFVHEETWWRTGGSTDPGTLKRNQAIVRQGK
jgi:hypothetical protein